MHDCSRRGEHSIVTEFRRTNEPVNAFAADPISFIIILISPSASWKLIRDHCRPCSSSPWVVPCRLPGIFYCPIVSCSFIPFIVVVGNNHPLATHSGCEINQYTTGTTTLHSAHLIGNNMLIPRHYYHSPHLILMPEDSLALQMLMSPSRARSALSAI